MSPGGFARCQRLLKPDEYKRVFSRPCKQGDQYLTLLCRSNDLSLARLGLAIAKRNIKTAVARNRIKRLIRETFRRHQTILEGLDIVVLAKPEAARATNEELIKALNHLWQRLEHKCKDS